jgi:hypothetical protein
VWVQEAQKTVVKRQGFLVHAQRHDSALARQKQKDAEWYWHGLNLFGYETAFEYPRLLKQIFKFSPGLVIFLADDCGARKNHNIPRGRF